MQAEKSEDSDSNPYKEDSNPDSSKGCSDGWIQIPIHAIQIPMKKEVKLKATDSNP